MILDFSLESGIPIVSLPIWKFELESIFSLSYLFLPSVFFTQISPFLVSKILVKPNNKERKEKSHMNYHSLSVFSIERNRVNNNRKKKEETQSLDYSSYLYSSIALPHRSRAIPIALSLLLIGKQREKRKRIT